MPGEFQRHAERIADEEATAEAAGTIYALLNVAEAIDALTEETRTLRQLLDGTHRRENSGKVEIKTDNQGPI